MISLRRIVSGVAVLTCVLCATEADAEPMLLSRQYTRCRVCHYSATGGGLLTPYGRGLATQELSTFTTMPNQDPATGEGAELYGVLGNRLGPVHLGVDVRPSFLHVAGPGFSDGRELLMNADLLGAYEGHNWTLYGEVGRRPSGAGGGAYSYEYWVARQPEQGFGVRAGRFMPAYGIRFADHTAYNRSYLGFDRYGEVLGLEVSHTTDRALTQVSLGPGRADAVTESDQRRLTITGREQLDITPRASVVLSGLFRDSTSIDTRGGAFGVAAGYAPTAYVNTWSSIDALVQEGRTSYVAVNETSVEAMRGIWLKVSPQLRTDPSGPYPGLVRLALEADLLPRTHWNVDLSYYRDRNRRFRITTTIVLAQLHLYL